MENGYSRGVTSAGNRKAQELMREVFTPCDTGWRGIGVIPGSGLRISDRYAAFDAERKHAIPVVFSAETTECRCGDVLKGKILPDGCPLFGKACVPEEPVGPCMVSSEGTCAAYYRYGGALPMTADRTPGADKILLSHGEGGKRTRDLIGTVIARYFANPVLARFLDSGLLGRIDGEIAFTTDGHVVTPAFFPGGDIGRLAVSGTVNDLAVCGAKGLAISCGLVLEEGLPIETLERALSSMRDAAAEAGVVVACGDTKVVEKGKGDGIFINTAGVGVMVDGWRPSPRNDRSRGPDPPVGNDGRPLRGRADRPPGALPVRARAIGRGAPSAG